MTDSIKNQYWHRTMIIVVLTIALGICLLIFISEINKNTEIQLIGNMYSDFLQNNIFDKITSEDLNSKTSNNNLQNVFENIELKGFMGSTIWSRNGDLLYSTYGEKSDLRINDQEAFKKAISGETVIKYKENFMEFLNFSWQLPEIELFNNINLNGNEIIIITNINGNIIFPTFNDNLLLLSIIVLTIIMMTGIIIWGSIVREKAIKSLDKSTKEIQQQESQIKNIRTALDQSSIISITDYQGKIIYVNNKFLEISKFTFQELYGKTHSMVESEYHNPKFTSDMWTIISKGYVWEGEIKNRDKNGEFYWIKATIVPLLGTKASENTYYFIGTEISHQKQIEEKLLILVKQLENNDRLKEEFSSMVSHELKTPLQPILGYCDMLLEPELIGNLTPEQKNSINIIRDNSMRLQQLIGDVLDVQKMDLGESKFHISEFSLDLFSQEIQKDFLVLMTEKNIEFSIKQDCRNNIKTDKGRIRQVIDNLVKNSIDFIPQNNGKITIGIMENSKEFLFYVKDNGIGMTLEDQKNIFKKFYQVDTSMTRKHGGNGLGLVVCKGIVEGLGGQIWIESEKGKGSVFYFSIPKEILLKVN